MNKLILLIALAGFLGISPARSQYALIQGKVYDSATKEMIPFANITVRENKRIIASATTDFDGLYRVKLFIPGKFTIISSYVGYAPSKINQAGIELNDTLIVNFALVQTASNLQEVQVMAYRVPVISRDMTTSSGYVGTTNDAGLTSLNKTPNNNQNNAGIKSGLLTASELNDFSKWDLWTDIQSDNLALYRKVWEIQPVNRYPVQLRNADGDAVCNARVELRNGKGRTLWSAKTDNTGKAELWANLFETQKTDKPEIVVSVGTDEYKYENPTEIKEGINGFKLPVACKPSGLIDICFVVDGTGSMEDEISFLQSDLVDIIQKTAEKFPELSINLGSVFYRCKGNSYVTKTSKLSPDTREAINFIKAQDAGEGGDEVVEEGLAEAVDGLNWHEEARARLLFIFMDEPPLPDPRVASLIKKTILDAAEKGIRIFPVIGSAETPSRAGSMEYLMRSIALATNGTYIFLTDHSKIGDTHVKPVTDEYDVELLNALICRIIAQSCYMPLCKNQRSITGTADTTIFSNRVVIAHEVIDSTRKDKTGISVVNVHDFTKIQVSDTSSGTAGTNPTGKTAADTISPEPGKRIRVKFYPNPASSWITAEISGTADELFLTDISGKVLARYRTSGLQKLDIDLSIYSSGIYFLKFTDQGKWYSGKIILLH